MIALGNFDYGVSFTEEDLEKKAAFYNFAVQEVRGPERAGVSVFYKDSKDNVFHTYSTYARH